MDPAIPLELRSLRLAALDLIRQRRGGLLKHQERVHPLAFRLFFLGKRVEVLFVALKLQLEIELLGEKRAEHVSFEQFVRIGKSRLDLGDLLDDLRLDFNRGQFALDAFDVRCRGAALRGVCKPVFVLLSLGGKLRVVDVAIALFLHQELDAFGRRLLLDGGRGRSFAGGFRQIAAHVLDRSIEQRELRLGAGLAVAHACQRRCSAASRSDAAKRISWLRSATPRLRQNEESSPRTLS